MTKKISFCRFWELLNFVGVKMDCAEAKEEYIKYDMKRIKALISSVVK